MDHRLHDPPHRTPSLLPPQDELALGNRLHHINAIQTPVDPAKNSQNSQAHRALIPASLDTGRQRRQGDSFMTDYRVSQGDVQEDQLTAAIEKVTAQVPSTVYLALALGSMAVSVGLQAAKKPHTSLFVGQWAAPFLILGIYNKLVKLHGSDGTTHA
jgi:hypothetical protein